MRSPPAISPAAETCVTVVNLFDVETALFGLLVIVSLIAVPSELLPCIVKLVALVSLATSNLTKLPGSKRATPPETSSPSNVKLEIPTGA